MNAAELLWRIIMSELVMILGVFGVLLALLVWWLLRKLVAVPVITVDTDKDAYLRGETVDISGSLMVGTAPLVNQPVGLSIKPPTGDAYSLPSVNTDAQGNFTASWQVPADAVIGSYVLTATGAGVSATATFTLK